MTELEESPPAGDFDASVGPVRADRAWYAHPGLWITLVLMAAVVAAAVLWMPSAGAAGGCGGG